VVLTAEGFCREGGGGGGRKGFWGCEMGGGRGGKGGKGK